MGPLQPPSKLFDMPLHCHVLLARSQVTPTWPKAHYRVARALMASGAWDAACRALEAGLHLKPDCQVLYINAQSLLQKCCHDLLSTDVVWLHWAETSEKCVATITGTSYSASTQQM